MFDTRTVKGFWEFHNSNCWKISREGLVDFYLWLPTMKYIYKTAFNYWKGTTDHRPLITLPEDEREIQISFDTELEALAWFVEENS